MAGPLTEWSAVEQQTNRLRRRHSLTVTCDELEESRRALRLNWTSSQPERAGSGCGQSPGGARRQRSNNNGPATTTGDLAGTIAPSPAQCVSPISGSTQPILVPANIPARVPIRKRCQVDRLSARRELSAEFLTSVTDPSMLSHCRVSHPRDDSNGTGNAIVRRRPRRRSRARVVRIASRRENQNAEHSRQSSHRVLPSSLRRETLTHSRPSTHAGIIVLRSTHAHSSKRESIEIRELRVSRPSLNATRSTRSAHFEPSEQPKIDHNMPAFR